MSYAYYAVTDTTCSKTPTELTAYPLNSCSGGYSYTVDSSGFIYRAYYSDTGCSGAPSYSYKQSMTACTCNTISCSTSWTYLAALPLVGFGPVKLTTYYATGATGCTGVVSYVSYQSGQYISCSTGVCIGTTTAGYSSSVCYGSSAPSFSPNLLPTPAPTFKTNAPIAPSFSTSMPTPGGTGITATVSATQTVSSATLTIAQAQSPTFASAFVAGIQGSVPVTAAISRRRLLASAVVSYNAVSTTATSTTLVASLSNSTTFAAISTSLSYAGYYGVRVIQSVIVSSSDVENRSGLPPSPFSALPSAAMTSGSAINTNLNIIVGVVVGVVLLVIAVGLIVYCYWRKQQVNDNQVEPTAGDDAICLASSTMAAEDSWMEATEKFSGLKYWWNARTNETTGVGASKPTDAYLYITSSQSVVNKNDPWVPLTDKARYSLLFCDLHLFLLLHHFHLQFSFTLISLLFLFF